MEALEKDVRDAIRDIPDFPQPGVLFKDITPMLADPANACAKRRSSLCKISAKRGRRHSGLARRAR